MAKPHVETINSIADEMEAVRNKLMDLLEVDRANGFVLKSVNRDELTRFARTLADLNRRMNWVVDTEADRRG